MSFALLPSGASCLGASDVTSDPSGLSFNGPASSKDPADISSKETNGSAPCSTNKEYSRQLTALNCSVRDWITKHVNDNPLCDLNPIFRDYERHLASIERKYGGGGGSADGGGREKRQAAATPPHPTSSPGGSAPPSAAAFSFGKAQTAEPIPAGVTFNFGQKVDSSVLGSLASKAAPPTFSFSSNQSSLFGGAATKPDSAPPAGDASTADDRRQSMFHLLPTAAFLL